MVMPASSGGRHRSAIEFEAARLWSRSAALPYHLRGEERLAEFFAGLELVEPGLVSVTKWRPDIEAPEIDQFGAVGRKS
jgi:hypothetical protein